MHLLFLAWSYGGPLPPGTAETNPGLQASVQIRKSVQEGFALRDRHRDGSKVDAGSSVFAIIGR
jgi:hypothetical protein